MGISIYQLILVLFILLPMLLTIFSKRARGAEKIAWTALVFFMSWIGYGIFVIATALINSHRQKTASSTSIH